MKPLKINKEDFEKYIVEHPVMYASTSSHTYGEPGALRFFVYFWGSRYAVLVGDHVVYDGPNFDAAADAFNRHSE